MMTEVEEQKEKDIFQPVGRIQQPSQLEMSVTNKTEHITVITMLEQKVVMFAGILLKEGPCSQATSKETMLAGHNIHTKATEKPKLKWFIYL